MTHPSLPSSPHNPTRIQLKLVGFITLSKIEFDQLNAAYDTFLEVEPSSQLEFEDYILKRAMQELQLELYTQRCRIHLVVDTDLPRQEAPAAAAPVPDWLLGEDEATSGEEAVATKEV